MGSTVRVRRGRRRPPTGGSSRRRWSRAAAGSARARAIGGRAVLEHGVDGRRGHDDRERGRDGAAPRSARTARCAAASSPAGAPIGDHCVIDGMSVIGEGVVLGRRQRRLQRRAAVPGRDAAGRGTEVLMTSGSRRGRRRRLDGSDWTRCSASPSTWRTRCGAWNPRARVRSTRPGASIVAGMGGSASGGRLARGRARHAADAADGRSPTATRCPGWAGPSTLVLALELLRATPRRRWRPTTTPSRAARRGSWRRRAGRWLSARARDGVPVDPDPRRLPAARGDRLLARRGARGGARSAGAAPSVRVGDRGGGGAGRVSWPTSGGRTATRTRWPSRSRARCTGPCR